MVVDMSKFGQLQSFIKTEILKPGKKKPEEKKPGENGEQQSLLDWRRMDGFCIISKGLKQDYTNGEVQGKLKLHSLKEFWEKSGLFKADSDVSEFFANYAHQGGFLEALHSSVMFFLNSNHNLLVLSKSVEKNFIFDVREDHIEMITYVTINSLCDVATGDIVEFKQPITIKSTVDILTGDDISDEERLENARVEIVEGKTEGKNRASSIAVSDVGSKSDGTESDSGVGASEGSDAEGVTSAKVLTLHVTDHAAEDENKKIDGLTVLHDNFSLPANADVIGAVTAFEALKSYDPSALENFNQSFRIKKECSAFVDFLENTAKFPNFPVKDIVPLASGDDVMQERASNNSTESVKEGDKVLCDWSRLGGERGVSFYVTNNGVKEAFYIKKKDQGFNGDGKSNVFICEDGGDLEQQLKDKGEIPDDALDFLMKYGHQAGFLYSERFLYEHWVATKGGAHLDNDQKLDQFQKLMSWKYKVDKNELEFEVMGDRVRCIMSATLNGFVYDDSTNKEEIVFKSPVIIISSVDILLDPTLEDDKRLVNSRGNVYNGKCNANVSEDAVDGLVFFDDNFSLDVSEGCTAQIIRNKCKSYAKSREKSVSVMPQNVTRHRLPVVMSSVFTCVCVTASILVLLEQSNVVKLRVFADKGFRDPFAITVASVLFALTAVAIGVTACAVARSSAHPNSFTTSEGSMASQKYNSNVIQ